MRILFGVQGTGNGHISRSRTLARALKARGIEVDYLFSGRAADGYFEMGEFGDYRTFPGLAHPQGTLSPSLLAGHASAGLPGLRSGDQRF